MSKQRKTGIDPGGVLISHGFLCGGDVLAWNIDPGENTTVLCKLVGTLKVLASSTYSKHSTVFNLISTHTYGEDSRVFI